MGSDEISDSVYRDAVSKLKILLQNTAENEHPTLKVGELQKIRGEKSKSLDQLYLADDDHVEDKSCNEDSSKILKRVADTGSMIL